MSCSNSSSSSDASSQYFETGPNLLLCKIPGLDQPSFPEEFQDSWDNEHVRLPCSKRHYNDVSQWPEIVEGLQTKITNTDQLSEVMLRWNKAKEQTWNIKVLEYFLNAHSLYESTHDQGTLSEEAEILDEEDRLATKDRFDSQDDSYDDEEDRILDEEHHQKWLEAQRQEHVLRQQEQGSSTPSLSASNAWTSSSSPQLSSAPLKSQYLSLQERTRFFDVILPRMQALALRLPELVHKPIPFLMQQQDSAITLSQEQIACLLANAFFNTFPCRNVPNKRSRRFTKRPGFKRSSSSGGQQQQNDQPEDDEDDSEDSNDEANDRKVLKRKDKGSVSTTKATRGGASSRGGSSNRGGRGGGQASGRGGKKNVFSTINEPRPPRKRRAKGTAALFEFFEDGEPSELCARLKAECLSALASGVENLAVVDDAKEKKDERGPKMPSINFISLFWAEDTSSLTPCSTAQAAKLRCILHYFDRVTTEMPTGTVTYHRQVIRKPVYLKAGQDTGELNGFHFHKVNVDSVTPLEEAPQAALQMDFANKNIGGGALDRGAVQEEIRFMICPELIISRLFTTQLEANESLLIKGAERYSNYIGYSKTFEWYSDHKDPVPRDALGRRMTNICAIDATPFKSKISRLNQFERYSILREFNKCLVGFRPSIHLQDSLTSHPIATGNWGCGAFGGDMQLKFVIQWMAASVLRESTVIGTGSTVSNDDMLLYYYTFGIPALQLEIENFLKVVESSGKTIDPKRVVDCIIQYPRRNQFGEIQSFREKSLLEYLGTAITFVPSSTDAP
ncbi:poly(ADP-ribose) glycohydrolase [Entomortierella parvispora]|uniref:poly(ADP-ribose) glycohydrolase n=1 Tax=Entomortierella parvispora TaxID=205924 RepID=A0A9P3H0Y8_9FUNG|nr:poly(ADP-ribose) glycohydrolase [Entomortierella parvispora]